MKISLKFFIAARKPYKVVHINGKQPTLLSLRTFLRLALNPYLSGSCSSPVVREVHARDAHYTGEWVTTSGCVELPNDEFRLEQWQDFVVTKSPFWGGRILHADIYVRCRKCNECADHKRRVWQARALFEFANCERTWFLTCTMAFHARLEADTSGDPVKWIRREAQLFMKRIRKNTGLHIRYLCAVERHKDGTPHLHFLIHDMTGFLVKRAIQSEWRHGFSNCKLAEKDNVFYVTKYIVKDLQGGRIPCSLRYGDSKRIEK